MRIKLTGFKFLFLVGTLLSSCGSTDNTKYYTITFNTGGEGTVQSQRVKEGERISRPTSPIASNQYKYFCGWELVSGDYEIYDHYSANWQEKYLGNYEGPYLALSDIVFSASWSMEGTKLSIISDNVLDYDLKNNAVSLLNHDYYNGIQLIRPGDAFATMSTQINAGVISDMCLWYLDLYDGEDSIHRDRLNCLDNSQISFVKDVFSPLSEANKVFVINNFDEADYTNALCFDGDIYGYPLFKYDYSWTDQRSGNIYNLSRHIYLSVDKYLTEFRSDRHTVVSNLAKDICGYYLQNPPTSN